MIIERPYVDRHYLEEYTGYYASTLDPPEHKTTRIHALDCAIGDAELAGWLAEAQRDYEGVRRRLEEAYLGFVVIRPLPSAPVGRTVVRAYRDRPSRCFAPAATWHRVHLAGFEIEVEGMPFQQQDQAVGACATTALWSALARVTRADGGRAVTPLAVTHAATRYLLSGRPVPADGGLDMNQMLGAIREFGYSPYVLASRGAPDDAFWLAVKRYVHEEDASDGSHLPGLRFLPYDRSFQKFATRAAVWDAIAPLYPKLRLSADDLISYSHRLVPLVGSIAGPERRKAVRVEHAFTMGGQYLRDLYKQPLDPGRLRRCVTTALLSRYVGVIRFSIEGEWFLDVVCDSTDIRRDVPTLAPVLLVLPREERHVADLEAYVNAMHELGPSRPPLVF